MPGLNLSSLKLTTTLVLLLIPVSFIFFLTMMKTENDYVYFTAYYFYSIAALLFITWHMFKGNPQRKVWLVFAILVLLVAILIHLASLYLIALSAAYQH
jgi:hypothetical protein